MRQKPRIRIQKLDRYEEFEKLVDIQRAVWGHEDIDLTPTHQFRISSRMGGILLGAYAGNELVGFVFSFPALFEGKLCQHSHLLAVLPAYQGLGVGKRLKRAQRDRALERGYDLITWTMDPLQSRNANLNFHALAATSRTYLPDFYGRTPALTIVPDLPTDRLLLEWPIGRNNVESRKRGNGARFNRKEMSRALSEKPGDAASPGRPRLDLGDKFILAGVPRKIDAARKNPGLVAAWQKALGKTLRHYFGRGYAVRDFLFGDFCYYVLGKSTKT
jgi:chorismate synthase